MVAGTEMVQSGLASSRARIYGILAVTYSKPVDDSQIDVFRHGWSTEAALSEGGLPETMRRGLREVRAWLEQESSQPSRERLAALQTEFVRLFRGLVRGQSPLPPYESVYTDGGFLYGPSTGQVISKYQQFHLKAESNEPPDYLALELDFMRFLCEQEAEARADGQSAGHWLEEQRRFLEEHLCSWVPAFCENIRKYCDSRFYSGIVDVTEGWVWLDCEIVSGLMNQKTRNLRDCRPSNDRMGHRMSSHSSFRDPSLSR